MHTTIRQYSASRALTDADVNLVETGFVPLLKSATGFVSYSAWTDGTTVVTVSTFQDRAGAEESVRLATPWVEENLGTLLPTPPNVITGDTPVRHIMADRQPHYGVIRDYQVNADAMDEIVQRAEAGFVPIVSAAPGFVSYMVLNAGSGRLVTLSSFKDQTSAEESVQLAATWIKKNLASLLPNPPTVTSGQARLVVRA